VSSRAERRTKRLRKLAESWAAAEPRNPGALGGPLADVSFVAGVAGALSLADAPYPRPGAEPGDVRRYFGGNPGAARVSVVGQLISAASLARFTATVAKLAGRSGRGSRGLRAVAVAGGGLAAASLATSALLSKALTGSRGEQEESAAALHRLMFAAGGPVHGAGFGMLVGALGLAGLRTGELPRSLAIAGLASGAAGLLSPLYFVWNSAAWFIPAGRFPGLLVSGIAGQGVRRTGRRCRGGGEEQVRGEPGARLLDDGGARHPGHLRSPGRGEHVRLPAGAGVVRERAQHHDAGVRPRGDGLDHREERLNRRRVMASSNNA